MLGRGRLIGMASASVTAERRKAFDCSWRMTVGVVARGTFG